MTTLRIQPAEDEPYAPIVIKNGHVTVCKLHLDDAPEPEFNRQQRRFAKLFVEAPAMLEALRKGLALYERELLHLIPSKDAKAFIDKTRAILARIEGAEA